jgi:hydrogenase nickel incorporation protein HypB
VIAIETDVLNKNNELANNNRTWLHSRGIVALNLLSSPGAGKTTLLECSIRALKDQVKISVLEGDQETTNDAARIRSAGAPVIQINTGAGCHLEANMVALGIEKLSPENNSLLFIENVGNLVCPALFDLGEERKIVILSVTEGEDKPLKYPHIFRAAELMILNKIDLLPHLDFDVEECVKNALAVNPKLRLFKLSAKSGEGMPEWLEFLKQLVYSASVVTPRSPR